MCHFKANYFGLVKNGFLCFFLCFSGNFILSTALHKNMAKYVIFKFCCIFTKTILAQKRPFYFKTFFMSLISFEQSQTVFSVLLMFLKPHYVFHYTRIWKKMSSNFNYLKYISIVSFLMNIRVYVVRYVPDLWKHKNSPSHHHITDWCKHPVVWKGSQCANALLATIVFLSNKKGLW